MKVGKYTMVVIVALFGLIAGCATPAPVISLTAETGDNSVRLSVALSELEKQSLASARSRARRLRPARFSSGSHLSSAVGAKRQAA